MSLCAQLQNIKILKGFWGDWGSASVQFETHKNTEFMDLTDHCIILTCPTPDTSKYHTGLPLSIQKMSFNKLSLLMFSVHLLWTWQSFGFVAYATLNRVIFYNIWPRLIQYLDSKLPKKTQGTEFSESQNFNVLQSSAVRISPG